MTDLESLLSQHCASIDQYLAEWRIARTLGGVEHLYCVKYKILPSELLAGALTARKLD